MSAFPISKPIPLHHLSEKRQLHALWKPQPFRERDANETTIF